MPSQPGHPTDSVIALLTEFAPELRRELPGWQTYAWAKPANRDRASAELEAAKQSEAFSYPHHVEMHVVRARQILRSDMELREE